MTARNAWATLLLAISSGLIESPRLAAEVWDLKALRDEQRNLEVIGESLGKQRLNVVETADSLAFVIDSLKRVDPEAADLKEALLSSMTLVHYLVTIDHRFEDLTAAKDALDERMRSAYDWEISRLFSSLSEAPDEGLLVQLMIMQEQRQALGDDIEPSRMRYSGDMSVARSDGPVEISQKVEFLEDRASLLREESRRLELRIGRLADQGQFERRLQLVAEQMRLSVRRSDEGTRATELISGSDPRASLQLTGAREPERNLESPGAARCNEIRRQHLIRVPSPREFDLETHKLRARQQELREMEAVLEERIQTFRSRLHELLDGGE